MTNNNPGLALSDLTRILIGVFLNKDLNGNFNKEPSKSQVTRATQRICDVVEHTMGFTIPRDEILTGAYRRYKSNLSLSVDERVVGEVGFSQNNCS